MRRLARITFAAFLLGTATTNLNLPFFARTAPFYFVDRKLLENLLSGTN